MLCDELGWSEAQQARWLADTLTRALLPDADPEVGGDSVRP